MIHSVSLRPSDKPPGVEVIDEGSRPFVDVFAEALGLPALRV
jgi:arginine deiminase